MLRLSKALEKAIDEFEGWVKLRIPSFKYRPGVGTIVSCSIIKDGIEYKCNHTRAAIEQNYIAQYREALELEPLYEFRNQIKNELSGISRGRTPEYSKREIIANIIGLYQKHFGRPGFTPYGPLHSIVIEAFDALGIILKDPSRLIKAELKVKD
jgi:hypothetical protein